MAVNNISAEGLTHEQLEKLRPPFFTGNLTVNNTNGTTYLELDEDQVSPGFAVLLMYLMLFMILGVQTGLLYWKKQQQRSYELVSLAGLWLMPAIISARMGFWRFIFIWLFYSVVTGYLFSTCTKKKLHHSTPYKVYTWFLWVYKISRAVGIAGYIMLLLDIFGVGLMLAKLIPQGTSLVLLWYGLYFGILGRDCAEVASSQIAQVMGSGARLTSTVHNCGICGGELKDFSHVGEEASENQRVRQLACKHCFHELCVRGWTIVGKKDVCPVCLEKVDLRDLYADRPWDTRNLSWMQMLDSIRYMVVWNPLIFLVFSALTHFAPHHHIHRHIRVAANVLAQIGLNTTAVTGGQAAFNATVAAAAANATAAAGAAAAALQRGVQMAAA